LGFFWPAELKQGEMTFEERLAEAAGMTRSRVEAEAIAAGEDVTTTLEAYDSIVGKTGNLIQIKKTGEIAVPTDIGADGKPVTVAAEYFGGVLRKIFMYEEAAGALSVSQLVQLVAHEFRHDMAPNRALAASYPEWMFRACGLAKCDIPHDERPQEKDANDYADRVLRH
jgi:hypothetical protein